MDRQAPSFYTVANDKNSDGELFEFLCPFPHCIIFCFFVVVSVSDILPISSFDINATV